MGNKGYLKAGDIQFMRAGSGIIHDELPSEKMMSKNEQQIKLISNVGNRKWRTYARVPNLDQSPQKI
jgi:hypothetical protein